MVVNLLASDEPGFTGDVIILVVGRNRTRYAVHESRLRESSSFFNDKIDDLLEWDENDSPQEIRLPDDDKDIVYLYVLWLYRQRICIYTENVYGFEQELIKLFVFGEKIADRDLQDAVVDAMIVYAHKDIYAAFTAPTSLIDEAYQGTPTGSPLRRLLVDFWVHRGDESWVRRVKNETFLADVAIGLMIRKQHPEAPDPTIPSANSCAYHHHGPDKDCYVKRYDLLVTDQKF